MPSVYIDRNGNRWMDGHGRDWLACNVTLYVRSRSSIIIGDDNYMQVYFRRKQIFQYVRSRARMMSGVPSRPLSTSCAAQQVYLTNKQARLDAWKCNVGIPNMQSERQTPRNVKRNVHVCSRQRFTIFTMHQVYYMISLRSDLSANIHKTLNDVSF